MLKQMAVPSRRRSCIVLYDIKRSRGIRMRLRTLMTVVALFTVVVVGAAQNSAPTRQAVGAFGESEYRLGPEDVIEVFVWKEPELSTSVVVRPDGNVSLPLIGELPASGKTSVQLQREITLKLKELVS